ncbi:hypothetical protein [Dehalococcoides sp.]|uniref:hypothetical protein n=1 Tax=Dehalococcoides sp. TaxID=1966486 RepID=UPI002ACB10C9|nr:hypothetical protein [Dehalococcoides sp.]
MINVLKVSNELRRLGINLNEKRIRIASYINTEQCSDLTLPPNCRGFGRIHHFRRYQGEGWPLDPLPIDPARHALGLPDDDEITAEVFQNAVCNLKCWYCYVDRRLISANPQHSSMLTAEELIDCYLSESLRPPMIDISGGQPDLVPEWVLWFADTIKKRHMDKDIYLWSDDNLTTDFLWRFLNQAEIKRLSSYENYGRVGCFKGFDPNSFSFNTGAPPEYFKNQFSLMRKLIESGFDVYGYVTLTSNKNDRISSLIADFIDKLQSEVHPLFPLRTIPQRILEFTPTQKRTNTEQQKALQIQNEAVNFWQQELNKRFSKDQLETRIYKHKLNI